MRRSYLSLAIGSALALALDQWSKFAAVEALSIGPLPADSALIKTKLIPVFEGWFNLRLAGNKGAAWSVLSGLPDDLRIPFFLTLGVLGAVVVLATYHKAAQQPLLRWGLTLFLGGLLGNLIDRARLGYVIDFIDWFYGTYHWPTFNIADVALLLGAACFALDIIRARKAAPEGEGP